ncbi:MAG: molybdenum ABC transporter ATP-binding protein [Alphaproteobacteria bacterium]|nr:molybdenum ABC transporter ATP-binding protein [Alphaproteobacteria bacterium]
MTIDLSVEHQQGSFKLNVRFASGGTLTGIFGASGSGKTTLINIIAGLIRPSAGRVAVNGHVLIDTARGICHPAHRRRIGYVFQDARLFPHLTVAQNLAYGQWFTPGAERYARKAQIIDLLGIGNLLQRRPERLSGGEKQRVAIGRAILASPHLLLMDEPLASLDQARKDEILPYIESLRDDLRIPIIYVSHAMAEIARLASHVAVLSGGRLSAFGPTPEIMNRRDLVAAGELDDTITFIDMAVEAHDEQSRMTRLASPVGEAWIPGQVAHRGQSVRLRIKASEVMLATERPRHISALNIFQGTVAGISACDQTSVYVRVDCGGSGIVARITRHSRQVLEIEPGRRLFVIVKALSLAGTSVSPEAH